MEQLTNDERLFLTACANNGYNPLAMVRQIKAGNVLLKKCIPYLVGELLFEDVWQHLSQHGEVNECITE